MSQNKKGNPRGSQHFRNNYRQTNSQRRQHQNYDNGSYAYNSSDANPKRNNAFSDRLNFGIVGNEYEQRNNSGCTLQRQEHYGSSQSLPCFDDSRNRGRYQNKNYGHRQNSRSRARRSSAYISRCPSNNSEETGYASSIINDDNSSVCSTDSVHYQNRPRRNIRKPSYDDLQEDRKKFPHISVYWDIENCPIPHGKSALLIVKQIRETFFKNHTEDEFIAVCDTSKMNKQVLDHLHNSSVNVMNVNADSKNAADELLKRKLREFGERIPPEATVIVITSDINFVHDLHDLRYKKHMRVILIHNFHVSEALQLAANECILYEELISKLPDNNMPSDNSCDLHLLYIENLPNCLESELQQSLNKLFSIYKGKIDKICTDKSVALIKFSSQSDALKAKSRFQSQDVCGSKIEIDYLNHYPKIFNTQKNLKPKFKTNPVGNSPVKEPKLPIKEKQSTTDKSVGNPCTLSIKLNTDDHQNVLKLKTVLKSFKLRYESNIQGNCRFFTVYCSSVNLTKKIEKKINVSLEGKIEMKVSRLDSVNAASDCIKENISFKDEIIKRKHDLLEKHENKYKKLQEKIDDLKRNQLLMDTSKVMETISVLTNKLQFLQCCQHDFELQLNNLERSSADNHENNLQNKLNYECLQFDKCLPIYTYRKKIITTLKKNSIFILSGPPGSGKTTQLIQYVLEAGISKDNTKIVCSQPSEQLVTYYGSYVGQQTRNIFHNNIGYHVGNTFKNVPNIKAVFMSENKLLEESYSDPFLLNFSCVIVDGDQDSLSTKLLQAYLKQILFQRKDLHVIIISTTARAKELSAFFNGCSIVEISHPSFPVLEIKQTLSKEYIHQCITHALNIHLNRSSGDILIIVPSSADVMVGIQMMANQSTHKDLKVIALLSNNNFSEIQNELEKNLSKNYRNVIFMTSDLENAITLSSVSFIIDSGLKNEQMSTELFSSYEIKPIDLSIVTQRTYKAGISFVGEYVRLTSPAYTSGCIKYSEERFLPLTILHLLKRGENPWKFDLLHRPSDLAIKLTMNELNKMGIIEKEKLTTVGEKLIKFPLPLHLSFLLWNSLDKNLGYETLIMCAAAEIIGSGMPLRNEQHSADLLEVVNLFLQWKMMNKKQRSQFINNLKSNAFVFTAIDHKANEIQNTLKNIGIKLKMKSLLLDWQTSFTRFIVQIWYKNLCFQQKPQSKQYVWSSSDKKTLLALKTDRNPKTLPQNLIFERFGKDNCNEYILQFIPVGESDLFEIISPAEDNVEVPQNSVTLHPVGHYLLQTVIIGKDGKHLTYLEKKLSEQIKSPVRISVFSQKGKVIIFASSKYSTRVIDELHKDLQVARENMKREVFEYIFSKKSGVRILISKGGVIEYILMAHEHVGLFFFLHRGDKVSDVLEYCKIFGQIAYHSVKEIKGDMRQMAVMFTHPHMAKNALINSYGKTLWKIRERHFKREIQPGGQLHQRISLQWVRRKNMGTCVIQFSDATIPESFVTSLSAILIFNKSFGDDVVVVPEQDKKRILLKKFGETITKTHVYVKINEILLSLLSSHVTVNENNIQMTLEPAFKTSNEEMIKIENEFIKIFTPKYKNQIVVHQPNDKDEVWKSVILTDDKFNEQTIKEKLRLSSFSNIPFIISSEYQGSIFFSEKFFAYYCKFLHPEIQDYISTNSLQSTLSFIEGEGQKGLKITVQNYDCISLYNYLSVALKPHLFFINTYNFPDTFTNNGENSAFLDKLENNHLVFIHVKTLTQCLIFFGPSAIKMEIQEYFDTQSALALSVNEEIIMIDCSAKGLMRKLFTMYGSCLEKLQIQNIFQIKLDFTRKQITAKGSNLAKQELMTTVNAFIYNDVDTISSKGADDEICPICHDFISTNQDHYYRLECCGHAYCLPCITAFLMNCQPPLLCLFKDCYSEIVYRDLKTFEAKYPHTFQRMLQNALRQYLKSTLFTICPFPDCNEVLPINEEQQNCSSCLNTVCTSCQVLYHYGQNCKDYQQRNNISLL